MRIGIRTEAEVNQYYSQFRLNPLDAKRTGVQEVHETSSTSARDVWYYSSRCSWQLEPLACWLADVPMIRSGQGNGTWHVPGISREDGGAHLSSSTIEKPCECRLELRWPMESTVSQIDCWWREVLWTPSGVPSELVKLEKGPVPVPLLVNSPYTLQIYASPL